ncbi:Uncharacterised protein [Mycobacteroides abscessus subsp. abscessus]|nr:Uncharacterised protein [Mycobacteroides abscessus subsp. abscessus]SKV62998.1 Uncharacterised protein [Mycobacteroides abscessus subsp. abscessus]
MLDRSWMTPASARWMRSSSSGGGKALFMFATVVCMVLRLPPPIRFDMDRMRSSTFAAGTVLARVMVSPSLRCVVAGSLGEIIAI